MKALVLRKHGGLGDLEVVGDYPVPQATEGNVVMHGTEGRRTAELPGRRAAVPQPTGPNRRDTH